MQEVKTRLWNFKFKHAQEFFGEFFFDEGVVADTESEAFRILRKTYGRLKGAVRCTGSRPIALYGYVNKAAPKAKLF